MNLASNFDAGNVQFQCDNEYFSAYNVLWHANLCSELREFISPQFIKKFPQFLDRFHGGDGDRSRDLTDQPI